MKVRAAFLACLASTAPVLVPAVAAAAPAEAWSDGPCPTAAGVTVVVDFQELGGGVVVRCASGSPASGFQALDTAGFAWSPTVRFPGFLCRIDGRPAAQPCQSTPPTTAYWSYWNAVRGGTWCYGNFGAGNRRPPEGTVEGWSFSLDRPTAPAPRVAPPQRVPGAPTTMTDSTCAQTTPTSTTRPPPTSTPSQPRVTQPAGPTAAPTPGGGTWPTPAGTPGAASAGPTTVDGTGTAPVLSPTTTPTVVPATIEAPAQREEARSPSASPDGTPPTDGSRSSHEEAATGAATTHAGSGSGPTAGSPTGVIAAVVIVAALSATSAVVRRRVALTAEQP